MVYNKKYKITKKDIHLDYVKFELNGLVEFSNGNYNSIFCPNEFPYKNYQIGDVIEVDLTNARQVVNQSYHQEIVRKVSGIVLQDFVVDDYGSWQDEEEEKKKEQKREQIDLLVSAYDKKVVHKSFRNTIEWLEKCIEVAYNEFYPNWKIKKKVHDNRIKRQDADDPKKVESLFSSKLFGFKQIIEMIEGDKQSKQSLYDEVKKEYYEWLGATGINPSNCPPRLKHFLFEINEVLEGRGDKLERDIENRKWEIDPNSVEYEEALNKLFTSIGVPLENERNEYESLKGKNQKDITITNNFGGNSEQAEKAFKKMVGQHDYQDFNFVPQKDTQTILQEQSSSGFQQRQSSVIVRNVRQNPNHWRIDEVIINGEKKMALVHHSVEGEIVDLDSQPVYLPQRFNQAEIVEINQALGISQTSTSNQYYQENQSVSEKVDNLTIPNSNSRSLGAVAVIGGILAIAGAVVYGMIRKSKKIKN